MNLCAGCGTKIPERGYHGFQPFCVGEKPHQKQFCCDGCAKKWALVETVRLTEWLSRIAKDTRGMGADLATQALYSNTSAFEGKRRTS